MEDGTEYFCGVRDPDDPSAEAVQATSAVVTNIPGMQSTCMHACSRMTGPYYRVEPPLSKLPRYGHLSGQPKFNNTGCKGQHISRDENNFSNMI